MANQAYFPTNEADRVVWLTHVSRVCVSMKKTNNHRLN